MLSKKPLGFWSDRRGNIALMTALLAPVLLMAVGAGVDFSRWSLQRANLKEAADALSTRGAREFLLANASEKNIKAIIADAISHNMGESYGLDAFSHSVTVNLKDATVSVTLRQAPTPGLLLTNFFPYSDDISMTSTAVARGGSNVCLISLETEKSGAIEAGGKAQLTAPACTLLSNSVHPKGVEVGKAAKITAGVICSSGGYKGELHNYDPLPTTDCPPYLDPLAEREPPPVGACDFYDTEISDFDLDLTEFLEEKLAAITSKLDGKTPGTLLGYTRYTIMPGVYCGGLKIDKKTADVHFLPGVYVIKNGKFDVKRGARVFGEGVGFYLDGESSTFTFEKSSIINLTAPETGPMAGLLFWEADSVKAGAKHEIKSSNARQLLGTIYLKKGTLSIDSKLPIADASAYTAIVVNKIKLSGSPTLRLNADYAATQVPVPAGVGSTGGGVFLRD